MSGLSKPLEDMPQDIHVTLWSGVAQIIVGGHLAVTKEIYDELLHLPGGLGECVKANKAALLLEIGGNGWDWQAYLQHVTRMQKDHAAFISEFNGKGKGTIGLNDLSIMALGKALRLPVVSSEKPCAHMSPASKDKRKIPDICQTEQIVHLSFNDLLRAEGIRL